MLAKNVISTYIASCDLSAKADKLKLTGEEMDAVCCKVEEMSNAASQMLVEQRDRILQCLQQQEEDEELSKDEEMETVCAL